MRTSPSNSGISLTSSMSTYPLLYHHLNKKALRALLLAWSTSFGISHPNSIRSSSCEKSPHGNSVIPGSKSSAGMLLILPIWQAIPIQPINQTNSWFFILIFLDSLWIFWIVNFFGFSIELKKKKRFFTHQRRNSLSYSAIRGNWVMHTWLTRSS